MNKRIKNFYVAIHDNKVVAHGSNLTAFYNSLKSIEPDILSLSYYTKEFKESNTIYLRGFGKEYYLQKII